MNDFMKAVSSGDYIAAKAAFNEEMSERTAMAIEAKRKAIGATSGQYDDDDEE